MSTTLAALLHGWQPTADTYIRVSGYAAWWVLVLDVVVGTLAAGGVSRLIPTIRHKYQLHSVLGVLLAFLVTFHIAAIIAGHYHGWTYSDIDEMSPHLTLAHNAGIASAYLLASVYVVVALKTYVSSRVWSALHHTIPFAVLVLGTYHGLYAGTDAHSLRIILPAVMGLTFLLSVFIVRASVSYARRVKARKGRQVILTAAPYTGPMLVRRASKLR